jgi:hypothetical protein
MTGVVTSPTLTLEEFLKLPETKPASEFVNGRSKADAAGKTCSPTAALSRPYSRSLLMKGAIELARHAR